MAEPVRIRSSAMAVNDAFARKNRELFAGRGLRVVNMIGSPGCGKTSLLEALGKRMGEKLAVVTGDLRTTLDADRLTASGAQAVQIETGDACHLTAKMVGEALGTVDLGKAERLVIENVGNLVCPAAFDLGEAAKVAVLSVAEGDEKPVKYPTLFVRAGLLVITKTDLLPHVTFSVERVKADCAKLNSEMRIITTSVKAGEGIPGMEVAMLAAGKYQAP